MRAASMSLANVAQPARAQQLTEAVNAIAAQALAREHRLEGLLRCVSSGYLSDGCSCQATIPARVVRAAWARERELLGAHEDRFFSFAWRGGTWFSFGLRDGHVRGVYCPAHNAGRAERASARSVALAS